jgi:hypothetical protein
MSRLRLTKVGFEVCFARANRSSSAANTAFSVSDERHGTIVADEAKAIGALRKFAVGNSGEAKHDHRLREILANRT